MSSGFQHPKRILVFGDSHSAFFFESPYFVGRLGLRQPLSYRIQGEAIPAASVAGFRPQASKMQVKEKISEAISGAEYLILAFGQVDLELGYYYRLAIKKETVAPDSYVEWLLGIYSSFVGGFITCGCKIALKGVNLTALMPRPFATRYVSRIVTEGGEISQDEADRLVGEFILSEDAQNEMHLRFNAGLARLASCHGIGYFDLVRETGNGGIHGVTAAPVRLADEFKTARFDHHLADTVVVRRLHYEAAGRVFGMI